MKRHTHNVLKLSMLAAGAESRASQWRRAQWAVVCYGNQPSRNQHNNWIWAGALSLLQVQGKHEAGHFLPNLSFWVSSFWRKKSNRNRKLLYLIQSIQYTITFYCSHLIFKICYSHIYICVRVCALDVRVRLCVGTLQDGAQGEFASHSTSLPAWTSIQCDRDTAQSTGLCQKLTSIKSTM